MRRYIAVIVSVGCSLLVCTEPSSAQSRRDETNRALSSAVRLEPTLMESVQQRTKGILASERQAYYHVLNHARQADYESQKTAADQFLRQRYAVSPFRNRPYAEFPVFVDMFRHPAEYAGRPVHLKGHLRKLMTYPAGENDAGIETLYEGWLFTESSQGHPVVVVCTSLPQEMRPLIGESLINHVEVAGYYFKLYGYDAQDAARLAPLILAQRMEWHPQPEAGLSAPVRVLFVAILVVAVAAMIWTVLRWARSDREFRRRRAARDTQSGEPDFSALQIEADDPESCSSP